MIGAGAVGMATALVLQREGLSVTVYDKLPPGGGASFGNSGLISVDACQPISSPGMARQVPKWLLDPLGPLVVRPSYLPRAAPFLQRALSAGRIQQVLASSDGMRALHKPALEQYRALLGSTLFNQLIRMTGAIQILEGPGGADDRLPQMLFERHGIRPEKLDEADLRQLVPELSREITRGLFFRNNGYTISPVRLVQAMARLFTEAGGSLRHEEVLKLIPGEGDFRIITNSGDHRAGQVVVAGGAWSKRLLAPLGVHLPLETERGYHVMVRNPSVTLRVPLMHRGRGFALVPMADGLRLAGTVEFAGLEAVMDERRAGIILQQGQALLPGLSGDEVSIWMGHRPSLPDSLPVIDRVRDHPRLLLACGHGHTGLTAAATTGRLVAQLILEQPPTIDPAPYQLARFCRTPRVKRFARPGPARHTVRPPEQACSDKR